MKKRSVINYLAALICVAAVAYVFLWPHSLYDIAWLGVGRGEPETVRITADEVTDNPIRVVVTLPAFETAAFIDQHTQALDFPFAYELDINELNAFFEDLRFSQPANTGLQFGFL